MKCGCRLSLDGLTGEELRLLLRKHSREFNCTILSSMAYPTHWVGYIKGNIEDIVNMLDMLSSAGFTVELISFK